jgi:hypothetical protein
MWGFVFKEHFFKDVVWCYLVFVKNESVRVEKSLLDSSCCIRYGISILGVASAFCRLTSYEIF